MDLVAQLGGATVDVQHPFFDFFGMGLIYGPKVRKSSSSGSGCFRGRFGFSSVASLSEKTVLSILNGSSISERVCVVGTLRIPFVQVVSQIRP